MNAESWRPVPDWEGFYSVSDFGRIRSEERVIPVSGQSDRRIKPRVLRPFFPADSLGRFKDGHVVLCREHKPYSINIGPIVLCAFVGPRPEGCEAVHIDGDSKNNRLTNLAWMTEDEFLAVRLKNQSILSSARLWDRLSAKDIDRILKDPRSTRGLAAAIGLKVHEVRKVRSGRLRLTDRLSLTDDQLALLEGRAK